MPFWMLVLMLVTLIVLCWSGGYGVYRGVPDGRGFWPGSILGILGLVLLVVLVIMFVGGAPMPGR
jgi:hypothetical protein